MTSVAKTCRETLEMLGTEDEELFQPLRQRKLQMNLENVLENSFPW